MQIKIGTQCIQSDGDETILDVMLRTGFDAPHSCKAGSCQSCMMRVVSGEIPLSSQDGLNDALVAQKCFLPCVARATSDIEIQYPDDDNISIQGNVIGIEQLSDDVALVRIKVYGNFSFRAGQYVNLVREDGLVRSYSIASLPDQLPEFELHVRRMPNGRMSNWLCDPKTVGSKIRVRGPAGNCFYLPQYSQQDMLLVGTGTGLAPLLGIARDAISKHHPRRILLYHGGLSESALYYVDVLKQMDQQNAQFTYRSCVLNCESQSSHLVGSIDQIVLEQHKDLSDWRVFLCGAPDLVNTLRRKVFLAGANSKQIHADPFLVAKPG